jgi:hypothetical protein
VSFLLDTNVVSETLRPRPIAAVMHWLKEVDEAEVFVSAMTLGEVRYGVERLAPGRKRSFLEAWVTGDFPRRFSGRILSLDSVACDLWGRFLALSERRGRPMGVADALIAATAAANGLTLVTRDAGDFAVLDIPLFNPWDLS